ncbi:MAG: hypothetical protein MZV65_14790 [Chromatiales bacterium]|nr:hypothetical protein [Chromatiales bacterium]
MSHWLDRKPRTLVELWIVFAGLLLPLWWRLRRKPPYGAVAWAPLVLADPHRHSGGGDLPGDEHRRRGLQGQRLADVVHPRVE